MLREQEPRVTVSVCVCLCWVTVLGPVTEWGQRSNEVPLALTGGDLISCSRKLLVWLLRLGAEEREGVKQGVDWENKVNFEALSSGCLTSPHSQAGVGCNDTIVSRWSWWRGGSLSSLFSQESLHSFFCLSQRHTWTWQSGLKLLIEINNIIKHCFHHLLSKHHESMLLHQGVPQVHRKMTLKSRLLVIAESVSIHFPLLNCLFYVVGTFSLNANNMSNAQKVREVGLFITRVIFGHLASSHSFTSIKKSAK